MKYLQSYKLFESGKIDVNFDKIIEVLLTECSEFIKLLQKWNIEGLYRGQKNTKSNRLPIFSSLRSREIVNGFYKMKPFENRSPKDTKHNISKLIDSELENKFGIPLRSKGVFASKNLSIAKDYGLDETFLFFPKNGFRYFWNPEVDDLFTLLRDDTSWYDKEPFFWKPTEWLDFQQIVGGYREGGIQYVKYQELTFICDEYYLLDLDYYDQFINLLQSKVFENSGNASFDWLVRQNNENYLQLLDLVQSEILDDLNIIPKTDETFSMGYDSEGYPEHKFWTFRFKNQPNSDDDTSEFIPDKEIDCIIIFNITPDETGDVLSKLEDCKKRIETHTGKKLSIEEEPSGPPESPEFYDYVLKLK